MVRLRVGVVIVLNSRVENPSRAGKGERERKEISLIHQFVTYSHNGLYKYLLPSSL